MIVLTNIFPKKREHWCFINTKKILKFKGKTWKSLHPKQNFLQLKDNGITFILRPMATSFRIETTEARGYNNKYIESFMNSILNSLAKRPKICKDCVYRFQYNISRQCGYQYKKSMIEEKPE